jgi:hypothetical protein
MLKELGVIDLASIEYVNGRKRYARPQAMLFSNNPGTTVVDSDTNSPTSGQVFHVPLGSEINAAAQTDDGNEFMILSDDNRGAIDIASERIERRERMINGRMRSYYIADKIAISTSWDMLPSRSFATVPGLNSTGQSSLPQDFRYTTDGGAGGAEIVEWYENYTGSFYLFLAYDKFPAFGKAANDYLNMNKYNQVIEVMFSDFSHSVVKRGAGTHDFWNVSLSLEEV